MLHLIFERLYKDAHPQSLRSSLRKRSMDTYKTALRVIRRLDGGKFGKLVGLH